MYWELMIFMPKQEILWAPPPLQKGKGEYQSSISLVVSNSSMSTLIDENKYISSNAFAGGEKAKAYM